MQAIQNTQTSSAYNTQVLISALFTKFILQILWYPLQLSEPALVYIAGRIFEQTLQSSERKT